jgi:hypothetical protein
VVLRHQKVTGYWLRSSHSGGYEELYLLG